MSSGPNVLERGAFTGLTLGIPQKSFDNSNEAVAYKQEPQSAASFSADAEGHDSSSPGKISNRFHVQCDELLTPTLPSAKYELNEPHSFVSD